FIEVGGPRRQLEASPSVLAAPAPRGPMSINRVAAESAPAASASVKPLIPPSERAEQEVVFLPIPPTPPPLSPPGQRFAPELLAYHHPDHPVTEQYRGLWKALAGPLSLGPDQGLMFTAA